MAVAPRQAAGRREVKLGKRPADAWDMSTALARRAPYPVRANSKRCSKCGKVVSRGTFACRRCGKRHRMRPRTMLLIVSIALMAGMFAVASAGMLLPARIVESVSPVARGGRSGPASAGAQEIGAGDLWMAYAHDPAEANRRFKDRPLVVTGIVRAIDRDFDGGLLVRLSTGDAFDTVNARLATGTEAGAAALTKGKQASLLCVGRGSLIGAPRLASCYIR
jgi:hypothetical protein